ncbi:MAG TPA: hypothetical protein DCE41_11600 [Cytophagales bacterium]|nr:hypothetical protein [Cytophagales bacterium]HAA22338.1 hypothetical protein [Cytophagales bacterium]HAP60452.1 hypothetical protein [Cytophagales bacterium]
MPKFRSLTTEELQDLEKEFVEFLVINGVMADDWERLKADTPEKAEGIIDAFSDVVFESTLQQIHYLERRTTHDLKIFQCGADSIVLVGLRAPEHLSVDFRDETFLQNALIQPPQELELYTTAKAYTQDRSQELFQLTEQGCVITDGKLFKALSLALAEQQS